LNVEQQAALEGDQAAKRRYSIVADKMIAGMRQAPAMFPVDRVSSQSTSSGLDVKLIPGILHQSTKWIALRKGFRGKRPDLRNLDQDVRDMAARLEQEEGKPPTDYTWWR
jgi:hypothetical protein